MTCCWRSAANHERPHGAQRTGCRGRHRGRLPGAASTHRCAPKLGALADAAARERVTHRAFLAEVLSAEVDQRDHRRRARRLLEARFPRLKRLDEFDLAAAPTVNPATLAALAKGAWIDAGEPVVLIGDSGRG